MLCTCSLVTGYFPPPPHGLHCLHIHRPFLPCTLTRCAVPLILGMFSNPISSSLTGSLHGPEPRSVIQGYTRAAFWGNCHSPLFHRVSHSSGERSRADCALDKCLIGAGLKASPGQGSALLCVSHTPERDPPRSCFAVRCPGDSSRVSPCARYLRTHVQMCANYTARCN